MTVYRTADSQSGLLSGRLEDALSIFGFRRADIGPILGHVQVAGAWVRKAWDSNRAAVHLRAPTGDSDLGELAQELKLPLGKALGYIPFFYGLGLQIVWSGEAVLRRTPELDRGVDSIDNQRCIVQSLFVVDFAAGRFREARTWGQVVTGRFQDAIAGCLDDAFLGVP